ncbi:MAG: AAA family ATPase [Chloroflexi bacterium]|nr:AAA family ATPase [Chloroflexota bacterium]MBT7080417.1 AAA family ATPase [Chloroflexota bacterium]
MAKIITVAQHKGGTGKTITCVNLGASLAELGKSVLLVDLDPQASLSISVGVNPVDLKNSMHEVMGNQSFPIDQIIIESELPNLSVAPSDIKLALVEMQLASSIGREKVLHKKLVPIKDNYDYILLDSPPQSGTSYRQCSCGCQRSSYSGSMSSTIALRCKTPAASDQHRPRRTECRSIYPWRAANHV